MTRIEKKFKELKQKNQKAFIAFITAGYPNLGVTEKLVKEFYRKGVDIVELGVPFSDPMADGPIIQESSYVALKHNVNLNAILKLVRRLRRTTEIPICLMTYYNPIYRYGEERFVRRAVSFGVDGIIIPDLPPEEAYSLAKLCRRHALRVICFISPTTPLERIKRICRIARGFIYYVSLTGVTGPRKRLPKEILEKIKVIKRYTPVPVCVGFGVSRPQQVRQLCKVADGVIVGSAIIKKIKQNITRADLVQQVSGFVETLARGAHV